MTTLGTHILLDLRGVDTKKANDESFIKELLTTAAEAGSARILKIETFSFSPQGITGFALLAESHISIHSWPENDYVAVDLFFCGGEIDKAVECILAALAPLQNKISRISRGVPL